MSLHFPLPKTRTFRFSFHTSRLFLHGEVTMLPILCVRYFWWEREREREREIDGSDVTIVALNWRWIYTFPCPQFAQLVMSLHFPLPKIRTFRFSFTLPVSSFTERSPWWRWNSHWKWRHPCRAKIGDEFTLSLAKSSHNWRWAYTFPCPKLALFVSPFTLPVSSFTERSPWWRWNSHWVHIFHCQKFVRPQALFPLFQMARAARRVIENPRQMIKSCPVLFCSSHRKTESN